MIAFPSSVRVFLAVDAVDMRKGFNGLWAVAAEQLRVDPFDGSVFVFTNRRRSCLKILYWDGSGVWVLAKRLEKGRFSWPDGTTPGKISLAPEALALLLGGIDLRQGCKKAWYERI